MPKTDPHRVKSQLRLEIARLRRRIDGRIRRAEGNGRRLLSWQTYVVRYPGYAVLAALSVGAAVSGGLRAGWSKYFGQFLARRLGSELADAIWDEARAIWRDSRPDSDSPARGGNADGRS
jgi:hypothetical protein